MPRRTLLETRRHFILQIVAFGVFANGLLIILSTLVDHVVARLSARETNVTLAVPLLIGLSFIYLASLLARRKRTAWSIALLLYAFLLGYTVSQHMLAGAPPVRLIDELRNIGLPLLVIIGLAYYRDEFTVKSDLRNFGLALRTVIIVLLIALFYGVIGFEVLDVRDFHQEISLGEAVHRTVDQFDLTTNHALVPHTRRARLFVDSLSIVSTAALFYAALSLFQPLRARLTDQSRPRERLRELLEHYPATSEDWFKLWPSDKSYFLTVEGSAGLAYRVERGVALVVRDMVGEPKAFPRLLSNFSEVCYGNDWLLTFIHIDASNRHLLERHSFQFQKIGEEAIVQLDHFTAEVATNKYFRHITNKFTKQGFTYELLQPPHHTALLGRLRTISDDWLELPGRVERSFMLGYFDEMYLQQCPIMVVRDAAGTIQAFLNQVHSFDPKEANYDLLRYTRKATTNINDFLLLGFTEALQRQGFEQLNLGLCPLAGLDNQSTDQTAIDSVLRFVYSNGDRLFSFEGLRRFKAKYEPAWEDRYIAYRGGLRGLIRTTYALGRAMGRVPRSHGS